MEAVVVAPLLDFPRLIVLQSSALVIVVVVSCAVSERALLKSSSSSRSALFPAVETLSQVQLVIAVLEFCQHFLLTFLCCFVIAAVLETRRRSNRPRPRANT